MSKLPLKVTISIRDQWGREDEPVQKALASLKEVIGFDVVIHPQWLLLFTELEKLHPDKVTFVPSIAAAVQEFATVLASLLDDNANADWADTVLEKANGRLRIFIETSKNDPAFSWSQSQTGFVLQLPSSRVPTHKEWEILFQDNLLDCFSEKRATSSAAPTDDWASVSMDKDTGTPAVVESSSSLPLRSAAAQVTVPKIPDAHRLARLDEVILDPPYHLTVSSDGTSFFEVQCSHSPTLEFLDAYLKRWTRSNPHDSRNAPALDIKLVTSAFGLGKTYDRLTVTVASRYGGFTLTPMAVLNIVESTLGYTSCKSSSGSWVFRRDAPFSRN